MVQRVDGIDAVRKSAANDELIVVCLHNTDLPDELKQSLPDGFREKRFVAKFVGGQLQEIRPGQPENVIGAMLNGTPLLGQVIKSCEETGCDDRQPVEIPSS